MIKKESRINAGMQREREEERFNKGTRAR